MNYNIVIYITSGCKSDILNLTFRKYQPFLLAENYSQQLRRFVTALGDYRGRNGYPKSWPETLSNIQLVVES